RRHTRSKRDWSSDVCSSDLVSIVCTVLENDYDNSPEVVALLGASIAVSISDIQFDYVVAGCQVGIVDGKTVINPTSEQRKVSERSEERRVGRGCGRRSARWR